MAGSVSHDDRRSTGDAQPSLRSRASRATIRDVAARAGVSTATVSRVLAGIGISKPETASAVMSAVHDLRYRPSGVARSLRMRRTRTFGLIVTDIQNPFFPELVQAADIAGRAIGYSILLGSAAHDEQRAMHYLDLMVDRQVDGMIIATSEISAAGWAWLAASPVPIVIVNAESGERTVSVVTSDNEGGIRLAAQHLLDLGHRRIAYIRGAESFTADVPRLKGFRAACRAAGIPESDTPELHGDGQFSGGERATTELLRRRTRRDRHRVLQRCDGHRRVARTSRRRGAGAGRHERHRLRRHRGGVVGGPGPDDGGSAEGGDGPDRCRAAGGVRGGSDPHGRSGGDAVADGAPGPGVDRPGGWAAVSVRNALIGCVPIVWNDVDHPDLAPDVSSETLLDEFARLGFAGIQHGHGWAEGDALRSDLDRRGLRLAELYSALPATPEGLADGAADLARRDLARLIAAGGEVLVVALDSSHERDGWSGRVSIEAPRWAAPAYDELADLLAELANAAPADVRVAFHPHAATWIEAPNEVEALALKLPETGAGLCLDVGHYTVGGGEPVRAIRAFGPLVTHVHLKDVDPSVLAGLRSGALDGFGAAVRARIFTELGNGMLDLVGTLGTLDALDYAGWLMVEQDSTWLRPAEAAAVGKRVLEFAIRELDR